MPRKAHPWFRSSDGWWYITIDGSQHKLARGRANREHAIARWHELLAERASNPGIDSADHTVASLTHTGEEIMNLELGDAIVRVGGFATAANIHTYPPPEPPEHDPTRSIQHQARCRFSKPRKEVEQELEDEQVFSSIDDPAPAPPRKSRRKSVSKKRGRAKRHPKPKDVPRDPNEDDLVQ